MLSTSPPKELFGGECISRLEMTILQYPDRTTMMSNRSLDEKLFLILVITSQAPLSPRAHEAEEKTEERHVFKQQNYSAFLFF